MEKTTITLTTPKNGNIIVIKSFITGREKRALTGIFLNGEIDFSADAKNIRGLKGELIAQAEDLALKTIVISVDGKTDDVVNAVLDLDATDYAYTISEVNKVSADQTGEELKKN